MNNSAYGVCVCGGGGGTLPNDNHITRAFSSSYHNDSAIKLRNAGLSSFSKRVQL